MRQHRGLHRGQVLGHPFLPLGSDFIDIYPYKTPPTHILSVTKIAQVEKGLHVHTQGDEHYK